MQGQRTEKSDQETVSPVPCKYCRDPISPDALICKTCNEPQGTWRRSTRLLSAALSSVVAAGSLGIAYLQYAQTVAAQKETAVAKTAEAAQVPASQNAVHQIFNGLPLYQRTTLVAILSRQLRSVPDAVSLQGQIQNEPTNTEYRTKLLLRQFVPLNNP